MAKKILIVTSSPRQGGNSARLAAWTAEGARDAGAEVDIVDVGRMDYKTHGCTACMGCEESEEFRCVIKDDASDLLASMPGYDWVIFATPVYFMGFAAQLKILIDRMFSLVKFDLENKSYHHNLKNTRLGLIVSCGGDEGSGLNLCEKHIKAIAGFFGSESKCFKLPSAPMFPGELDDNIEVKDAALDFGTELAKK